MRERRRSLALAAVLALVVVACGGGGATTTTAAPATTTTAAPGTTATTAAPIAFDIGVTEDTITVGLLADMTGIFSPLVQDIVAAQEVYWDLVNEAGGIGGKTVVVRVEDTNYNVDQHRTKYEAVRDHVAIISQSTGSPHTAGVIELMLEDDIVAIPLSWYSGWNDPAFDQSAALELGTNYCFEGMNVVEFMTGLFEEQNGRLPTWAVISFPGEYGQDGAFGAKHAISELGLELVYDGEGQVTPDGTDVDTTVITEIVANAPDIVFATVNPTNMGQIMGGAFQSGFAGLWTGSVPSYDFRMLDSAVAPLIDAAFFQSGYNVAWGTDVPGMADLVDAMLAARPDLRPSDAFVIGWLEAKMTEEILRVAAENLDMTRAGIKAAALSIEGFEFGGMLPNQSYSPSDDPNTFSTRASAIFDPDLAAYTAAGGNAQTIGTAPNGGTTGSALLQDFFVGSVAEAYNFEGRCFGA